MRSLAVVGGVLLGGAVLVASVLGLAASYSLSGWLIVLAAALVATGMVSARRRGITRAGLALLGLVFATRLAFVGGGGTSLVTLPGPSGHRWLGRVIDEQDVSLLGARVVGLTWKLPPAERAALVPAMHDAYVAMRASEGTTASPVLDTLLGRQHPEAFDAIVIEPRSSPPRAAVIFLHGYGGSFTLECWMMAEAARAIDAVTVCPSSSLAGKWWTPEGERTVRATIAYLEGRGLKHPFLSGLSNGGIGASLLASRLAPSIAGLVLISGASPNGSTGGLPALALHGESDMTVSAAASRAFASRTGATYVGLDGGHFVMMVRREEVRERIAEFLRRAIGGR
ncbi:MAG TPA: hypothetical protein VGI39_40990 [Polyangiaceae bacterium]